LHKQEAKTKAKAEAKQAYLCSEEYKELLESRKEILQLKKEATKLKQEARKAEAKAITQAKKDKKARLKASLKAETLILIAEINKKFAERKPNITNNYNITTATINNDYTI
jgi:hypothetical protein